MVCQFILMMRYFLASMIVFCAVMQKILSIEDFKSEVLEPGIVNNKSSVIDDDSFLKTLKSYEIVQPVQYKDYQLQLRKNNLSTVLRNNPGMHVEHTHFRFEFEFRTYVLDVSLNLELIPSTFHVTNYLKTGKLDVHHPSVTELNHCYYQGTVRGVDESKVILSACNGLRGSIFLSDHILFLEPLSHLKKSNEEDVQYVAYRSNEVIDNTPSGVCGNGDPFPSNQQILNNSTSLPEHRNRTMTKQKRNIASEKRFVELLLVVDNILVTRLGTQTAIEERAKQIANFIDGVFQKIDLRIVLSSIEIWSDTDRIIITDSASKTLDELINYRTRQMELQPSSSPWVYVDNVQLLHGDSFSGFTVGIGSVGTMCSPTSAGVSQDVTSDIHRVGAIVAHEMGHNFALEHDTTGCVCPSGAECIMSAKSGSTTSTKDWTDCSKEYMDQSIEMGLHNCLVNVPPPSRIFSGAQCGNDITEEGEECDCGTIHVCLSKCCDPFTCKLRPGAICHEGLCCKDCQYVAHGTECRGVGSNECDLPEHCNGKSANCPRNVFLEDGSPCLSDTASCLDGVCLTYLRQCKAVWGSEATVGIDTCYDWINAYGNKMGSCGRDDSGNFVKCSPENVKCGKLICTGGGNRPVVGERRPAFINTINPPSGTHDCKLILSPDEVTDQKNIGMVRSGTLCAAGKSCQNRACVDMSPLTCSTSCSGNGVCNNLGNCHCDDGFAPPDCQEPGRGGSWDSGANEKEVPTTTESTTEAVITTVTDAATTIKNETEVPVIINGDTEVEGNGIDDGKNGGALQSPVIVALSSCFLITYFCIGRKSSYV